VSSIGCSTVPPVIGEAIAGGFFLKFKVKLGIVKDRLPRRMQ
jgi:hypothetical protein